MNLSVIYLTISATKTKIKRYSLDEFAFPKITDNRLNGGFLSPIGTYAQLQSNG